MAYHGTCAYCGASFTRRHRQECCSRSCSATLQHARSNIAWTPQVDQWLSELPPNLSLDEVEAAYKSEAERQGWPTRSMDKLRKRLDKLELFRERHKPVLNLTTGVLYSSSVEAAEKNWITASAIRNAARGGTLSVGCRWKYVERSTERTAP